MRRWNTSRQQWEEAGDALVSAADGFEERSRVTLMSLHSAKGLEFPQVYMVGLEEGLLPHRHSMDLEGGAIEEERRLCYVGMTRAQERLTLTMARTRRKWGKPRETIPSRFLFELIGQADRAHAHVPHGKPQKRVASAKKHAT